MTRSRVAKRWGQAVALDTVIGQHLSSAMSFPPVDPRDRDHDEDRTSNGLSSPSALAAIAAHRLERLELEKEPVPQEVIQEPQEEEGEKDKKRNRR